MKYSKMQYGRPDINKVGSEMNKLISDFKNAKSFVEADEIMYKINSVRNEFDSMKVIAFINYSNDTNNQDFIAEQDYFDNNSPLFNDFVFEYFKALVSSAFRNELESKYGKHLFEIAEINIKSFSNDLIEDMQKENHLGSEYMKLKASAKINFEGKELNLQELEPYTESTDREIRIKAYRAYWKFFSDNSNEFDEIYDKLVYLRNDMSQKMNYKNYKELGYARMKRMDYNEEMVADFRKNIKKYIVPLAVKLRDKQAKRIGEDKLMFYDIYIQFKSGNATPKGSPEWIMDKGKLMYDELSPETKEFYDFMTENDLMNVFSRKGKADMGYCEYIAKYKSPYIFSNMNGTEDDITVLTHEAGHAFQAYASKHFHFKEYSEPTMETAEIHSMSMEYLTYPWMNLFFEKDTDKFKFSHLNSRVNFLPYGVLVDEFQHWVYENPSVSPAERKARWRELEKDYMPHLNYDELEFLETGGRWQKQGHIYESPFYYIDYCLAQICAFQFWSRAIHNGNGGFDKALKDYLELCSKGGSKPFLELVKEAGLESPFEENVIKKLSKEIEDYIDSINDSLF
ncbi:MAG TPA: M3 family oligoendopeptidase [Ignavibacteria bacterium]|nr:M3 family oligoendopeptidase [Ignavibacteria bacterium]